MSAASAGIEECLQKSVCSNARTRENSRRLRADPDELEFEKALIAAADPQRDLPGALSATLATIAALVTIAFRRWPGVG